MSKILIIGENSALINELSIELTSNGFACTTATCDAESLKDQSQDLLLMDMDAFPASTDRQSLPLKLKSERGLPILGLVSEAALRDFDPTLGIDDFIVKPCKPAEMVARVRQILWRISNIDSNDLIKCADLVIDLIKYEVSISGRVVDLSFKEYELLKVLISNRGKVLTRQALMDRIWGYDYYGGDRTVDVHIRRLRSKIEDANHSFIETVRHVGYKFRDIGN